MSDSVEKLNVHNQTSLLSQTEFVFSEKEEDMVNSSLKNMSPEGQMRTEYNRYKNSTLTKLVENALHFNIPPSMAGIGSPEVVLLNSNTAT